MSGRQNAAARASGREAASPPIWSLRRGQVYGNDGQMVAGVEASENQADADSNSPKNAKENPVERRQLNA